jgi:hypothetical protein
VRLNVVSLGRSSSVNVIVLLYVSVRYRHIQHHNAMVYFRQSNNTVYDMVSVTSVSIFEVQCRVFATARSCVTTEWSRESTERCGPAEQVGE